MGRPLTQDEAALSVVERRASLRARILAEEHRKAEIRAAEAQTSLNCRYRGRVFGADHEPCQPPADDQLGLVCLCPCHDEVLGSSDG